METDQSYGIIACRLTRQGARQFLVVRHLAGHWGFPKGHLEPGEKPIDAARRELFEETGVGEVEIDENEPTFAERYVFTKRTGERVQKRVRYFLGRVPGHAAEGPFTLQPDEIVDALWGDANATHCRLTFSEGKELLDAVVEHLR